MTSHAAPRSRRQALILAIVALGVVALLAAAFFVVQSMRSDARAAFDAALKDFEASQATALDRVDSAEAAIASAEEVLATSEGKVLAEDSRTALATALELAKSSVTDTTETLEGQASRAKASADADPGLFDTGAQYREDVVTLASYGDPADGPLDAIAADLAPHVDAVTAAMAAWQAEQDRILRERYTNHVHAAGWTAELDQCKGSVDLSARYGTAAIAEHWSCGGKNFPDEPGTIIQLTGVREGTYRVEGIVKMLNQRVATIADVPTGYDLIYQTCQNGQPSTMSMTALTKIG